ncbi:MAG: hypothetical protein OHK0036_12950 [Bacteroidia bacterium]
MKTKLHYIAYAIMLISQSITSQNVSISASGAAPDVSAGLDVNFTDRGLLIPRVNLTNTGTFGLTGGSNTTSMLVYNTNAGIAGTGAMGVGYYYWNGTRWSKLLVANSPADAWLITGNAGTTAGTHFVGTTDNIDLVFKTNNTERMRITNGGYIGIATSTPTTLINFVPAAPPNQFLTDWTNNSNNGALARFYHTTTGNGSRVLFGITNYNGSAFATPGVIGLSLNNTGTGTGGEGVEADANNESGYALIANLAFTGGYTGWAGYFNADVYCGGTYFGSDSRLKKNITPLSNAIQIIKQLNPVSFYYNTDKYPQAGFEERKRFGFIAQEVEQVLPELVKEKNIILNSNRVRTPELIDIPKEEGLFKVLDESSLIPILTQAIKEQQQQIEQLQVEIKQLKEKQK